MDAQRGIARRMVVGLPREGLSPAWEKDFAAYPPAGVIVFGRDFKSLDGLRGLTSRLRELARPRRIFIGIDEEGGWVSQLGPHLIVPPNATLLARGAAPGDVEWAHRATGMRLRALGVDWNYAPVADVHSEPDNPVIGPRSFGSDPAAVAAAVGEAARGLRAGGVAACLKHYPGHGDTVLDSHLALPSCRADRETLARRELAPFRANLDAPSVMSAHVVYPALDAGRPATFSRAVVHDLMREELGYRGVVVTDALEMKGAAAGRSPAEVARLALEAGCDLLLFAFHDEEVRRARLDLARALVEGRMSRENFDAARPRLAEFDRVVAEPSEADLSVPLGSLTPPDWEARLAALIARGLIVRGALPDAARRLPLRVHEPEFAYGPAFATELAAAGARLAGESGAAVEVFVVASRVPVAAAEMDRMRAACAVGACVVVGMQSDAFLEALPEAAVRISAADCTPLTRRVVAGTVREIGAQDR